MEPLAPCLQTATVKTFTEERRMHLRLTQEHTDRTLLVKARYRGVHLPSNTTTKACSTMKCHSMDHMGTEAMVGDSQSFETCQLEGILGSRTRQSFLSQGTQALHKTSNQTWTWSKWRSGLFPGFFGRFGRMSSYHICNHYRVYLN